MDTPEAARIRSNLRIDATAILMDAGWSIEDIEIISRRPWSAKSSAGFRQLRAMRIEQEGN